jgi:hypothetical protein
MAITTVNQIYNPISGAFGSGNIMVYAGSTATSGSQTATTFTWTVPAGVDAVRVRLWGGGGYDGGAGGGFAIKSIYGLSGTTSVLVSVAFGGNGSTTTGGTSSFGSFVSATGGATGTGAVGSGVGGDINTSGGLGGTSGSSGGGGVGSIFGDGASYGTTTVNSSLPTFGGAGAGQGGYGTLSSGSGFIGGGAAMQTNSTAPLIQTPLSNPNSGLEKFSIDFIGTGGGGYVSVNGRNGGGGGYSAGLTGGIPGGGGGEALGFGAPGLVIVEW